MKRIILATGLFVLCTAFVSAAHAQMGMDLFKRPSFSKVFNPTVGKGAQYETINSRSGAGQDKNHSLEMFVVGKDSVDGKDGYWMEFVVDSQKGTMVGKSLITKDDFQPHRMIVQMAGQPAYEMPANMMNMNRAKAEEGLSEWHSVGNDSITVPAGTFACEHWRNDKRNSDMWISDKVTPFGMVKEVSPDHSTVLTKVITDARDRITGPVKAFDMQQMMQQMQQQRQQPQN